MSEEQTVMSRWRRRMYVIIFESDTPAGKLFDIVLIILILLSVLTVMLDSVQSYQAQYGTILLSIEWFFTILFTVEYILRLVSIPNPKRYAVSLFGVIDLIAILPTYLEFLFPGSHYLLTFRIIRVLRIFRILKLVKYLGELELLIRVLYDARRKIIVFAFSVLTLVVILGSLMYLVEGEESGFTSIPASVYWAIVTITTVGYGDISPETSLGRFLAAITMFMGFAIIAVPTGIVTVGITQATKERQRACPQCGKSGIDNDSVFCKYCGQKLLSGESKQDA